MKENPFSNEKVKLDLPEYVFKPNGWTDAFIKGLEKVNVQAKDVLEIGVGSGMVGIYLLGRNIHSYTGTDIDERILSVANRNFFTNLDLKVYNRAKLIYSDLFDLLSDEPLYDIICGCLPQISNTGIDSKNVNDASAKYFDSVKYSSLFNDFGLGLCEETLKQGKKRLRPGGSVILVLNGRCGITILERLFSENGYVPEILFSSVLPLSNKISIDTFIEGEKRGIHYFFYEDRACRSEISAINVFSRRKTGKDSFHKVYIIEGRLF